MLVVSLGIKIVMAAITVSRERVFQLKSGSTHTGNAVPTPALHHWEKLAGNTYAAHRSALMWPLYIILYIPHYQLLRKGKAAASQRTQ